MHYKSLPFIILLILLTSKGGSASTTEEDLRKLAYANNEFGFRLYARLTASSETRGNIVLSPTSVSTVFGMLYYGLRGDSAKELRNALGYEAAGIPDQTVHSTYHYLLSQISNSTNSNYILKLANAILVNQNLQLNPEYKNSVQDLYMSPVRSVDFGSDGPRIVEAVNKWVRENTNGKIRKILKDVHPMTAMILLNAIYFKAKWKVPFDPKATKHGMFYNEGREENSKRVPLMNHPSAILPYAETPDYQALELPYQGSHLSMLILLPKNPDVLSQLEQNLNTSILSSILHQRLRLRQKTVRVHLPRFKIEFGKDLSPDLQHLGMRKVFGNNGRDEDLSPGLKQLDMRKIFSDNGEDFSGIADESKRLSVSDVLHECRVEVNEEGSEAAAVTSGVVMFVRMVKKYEFRADRPFLFFVLDKRSDMVLFMGRLTKM